MAAKCLFVCCKCDMAVDSAVYHIAGDSQQVGRDIILHKNTLRGEGSVVDCVDVIVCK